MMYANLQRRLTTQQEESKVKEEALVKDYNELREAMEKKSDKMTTMMSEMMDLMKKQAKPYNAHLLSCCFIISVVLCNTPFSQL